MTTPICDCCRNPTPMAQSVTVQPARISSRDTVRYRLCVVCHGNLVAWQKDGGTNKRAKDPVTKQMVFERRCTVHDWIACGGDTAALAASISPIKLV